MRRNDGGDRFRPKRKESTERRGVFQQTRSRRPILQLEDSLMTPSPSHPTESRPDGAAERLILDMRGIGKRFPGVVALDDVDFSVRPGEVHVLLGENGAGKSTMIKIISGVVEKDTGEMEFEGEVIERCSPALTRELGISVIHQELSLVRLMDVKSNLFLGRDLRSANPLLGRLGVRDEAAMERRCREIFTELRIDIDPNAEVLNLSLSDMQFLEIAKAVAFDAKVILMDEPTSSLGPGEKEALFEVIERLTERGIGVVYVSHTLEDCLAIGDRISVLRDGRHVGTIGAENTEVDTLIRMMTGRTFSERYPRISGKVGEEVLEVRNFTTGGVFADVSFKVKGGEILGFAGLVGAGRTELFRALFGLDRLDGGELFIDGEPVRIRKPRDAIRHGLSFLTEDRKNQGVFPLLSVLENLLITLFNFGRESRSRRLTRLMGWVNGSGAGSLSRDYVQRLSIKVASLTDQIAQLSGGNQQKVLLARGISTGARIVILDEPTKGVDAGAKVEIYRILEELAQLGVAIIVISSELPEVTAICSRIIVMNEGRITGEVLREDADAETIMRYATGTAA